jgi:hypothetical protein
LIEIVGPVDSPRFSARAVRELRRLKREALWVRLEEGISNSVIKVGELLFGRKWNRKTFAYKDQGNAGATEERLE